jgi:hypothetical protein
MVFPLSVVCRSPRSIGSSVCTLLVAKNEKAQLSNKPIVTEIIDGKNESASGVIFC